MKTDYLLIGGGLAVLDAATNLRRQHPDAAITIVSDEPYLPYNRPPLSKQFLRGKMPRERLFLTTAEKCTDNQFETILAQRVVKLAPDTSHAQLDSGEEITFGHALLATGGRPIRLPVPGAQLPHVHYLRTLDDAEAIAADAIANSKATIIGAGFIGLELASSLVEAGVDVTVVERESRIWARFADAALAEFVETYCSERGIQFKVNETVAAIIGDQCPTAVALESGTEVPTDFVCVGIGIQPNVELAADAGLDVDNGIVVNPFMQTSHPSIYAAGDVVNYWDPYANRRRRVEHFGHARYSGALAARNMAGDHAEYDFVSSVWSDIFDLKINAAGDEHDSDSQFLRGRYDDKTFAIIYTKAGNLSGCVTVNQPREFATLKKLIQARVSVTGREHMLSDPTVDLTTLL